MKHKKEVKRAYFMDDNSLIALVKEKLVALRADLAELFGYAITTAKLDELQANMRTFEDFPDDHQMESIQMGATQRKNAKAELIREAVASVMLRVQNKFGFGSARYKSFGTHGLAKRDDANLMIAALRVVDRATFYLADLAEHGLAMPELDALTTHCEEFKLLLIEHNNKIGERSIAQEDRVLMGNALFELLKKYCRSAKNHWYTRSEAHYSHYIIYNTPTGKHEEGASEVEE
ncbi:MAG TPA: hypothetical protein PK431_06440 [Chitinophagales bacterium]|nr:hypothetical protein [Chitinophagales bacterium]